MIFKKNRKNEILIVAFLSLILVFIVVIGNIKDINQQNELKKIVQSNRIIEDSLPEINAWGDSLTYGVGGQGISYPFILESLINLNVNNYGITAEGAKTIAYRQGALPIYVNEFKIHDEVVPVEVSIIYSQGEERENILLENGDSGINPCSIDGIEGRMSFNKDNGKYYFTRLIAGEEVTVKNDTQIITSAMSNKNENDINIIFIGTNNRPTIYNIDNIIEIQKEMIEYSGSDKYIVVGLTSKDYMSDIDLINNRLEDEFKDKFLDIRKYTLDRGLDDAGIEASSQDIIDIENGEIPTSLRIDSVHGNKNFYEIMGNQIYDKIIELKYINEEQKEYLGLK